MLVSAVVGAEYFHFHGKFWLTIPTLATGLALAAVFTVTLYRYRRDRPFLVAAILSVVVATFCTFLSVTKLLIECLKLPVPIF